MAQRNFLRVLIIAFLSLCLAGYVARSLSKFLARRLGVTTEEQPLWASEFPSLVICSPVDKIAPVSSYTPRVRRIEHDYLDGNDEAKK